MFYVTNMGDAINLDNVEMITKETFGDDYMAHFDHDYIKFDSDDMKCILKRIKQVFALPADTTYYNVHSGLDENKKPMYFAVPVKMAALLYDGYVIGLESNSWEWTNDFHALTDCLDAYSPCEVVDRIEG